MKPIARSKRRVALALVVSVCSSIVLFLKFSPTSEAVKPSSVLVPALTATKTATLQTDNTVPPNGVVNPGDRLRYLVTINNGAAVGAGNEALGVTLNDTIDANTTLVGGSVIASAIAVNDSYSSIGNVGISVPDGPSDLLANDLDANNLATPVLNITQINGAAVTFGVPMNTANGQVTVNANGSFSFNPSPGFEGNATFTYTLSNGTSLTDTGTVTVVVSGMIWFVNPAAAAGGDGRLNSPFNCFVGTNCFDDTIADDPGDNIFLYSGAHVGGQTLLNNQRLIGQGATTALAGAGSITGITVPTFSNLLPSTGGTNPTMTTGGANTHAITLGQGNTIRGITFGNTSGADLFATGTVGTLTIGPASGASDVTLNGNGQAMSLTGGGTLAARFASISSTNSAASGITLTSVGGSFMSPTTTITNPTTLGISVGSSPAGATFSFGNTTANQSGGTAVSLTSNAGTFSFTDLDLGPDSGQRGLLASSNSGSITIPSGTISTTNGTAVEITGVSALNLTPINIQFTSVSVTGSQSGIILTNTSSTGSPGGFSIVGAGTTDGSGGTMSNISGADGSIAAGIGIYLSNVSNISLTNMTFSGTFGNWAIRGESVNNFTFRDGILNGTFGSSTALDEGGMRFGTQGVSTGIKGTALFEGNTIGGGHEDNISIYVMSSDTLNLTVRDNPTTGSPAIFNNNATATGNDALFVESGGTSNVTTLIDGVDFNGARGDLIQTAAIQTTTQNTTIQNNTFNNQHTNIITGGGGLVLNGSGGGGTGINITYRIHNNTFKGMRASPMFAMFGGVAGTINGVVTNNVIGTVNGVFDASQANRGSMEGMGFFGGLDSKAPGNNVLSHAVRIEGNTFRDINGAAVILLRSNSQDNLGTCRFEATIKSNTFAEIGPNPAGGIYGQVGGASLNNDAGKMGLDIITNTINMSGAASADAVVLDQSSTLAQFYLPGYAGPAAPTNQVSTYLSNPPKSNTWTLPASNSGTGGAYANSNAVFGTNFVLPVPSFASVLNERADDADRAHADLTDLDFGLVKRSSIFWNDGSPWHRASASVYAVPSDDPEESASENAFLTSLRTFVADQVRLANRTLDGLSSAISPTAHAQDGAKADLSPESGENINRLLGTLPPGENIRVQFDVTIDASIPMNDFSVSNQGTISSSNHANVLTDDPAVAGTANPTVTGVVHPPTVTKAFNASNIAVGGTATLTFTVTNQNPATAANGITVNDDFPTGLVVAVPLTTTNTCGGLLQDNTGGVLAAGDLGIRLTGGSRPAGQSCTFSVVVSGTTDGVKNNVTGNIRSTEGGIGLTASATMTVISAPSFTKSFGAPTIALNGSTSLSFTITNNSANSQLTGVGFTDTLPAGLVVATPPGTTGSCGGGTITANQGTGTISLAGAILPASTNCTFSVNVTGTTAGVKNNSVQLSTAQLGNGATANASVTVIAPPTITKSFNPTTVVANNGFSTMTIAIANPGPNTVALTGVGVTDAFPAGMEVDAVPTATNSCGTGTFAPTAGATSVSISNATIPATGTCNFTVRVRGTTAGAKVNTTGNVSSTNGGTGLTASATLTVTNTVTWNGSQAGGVWTNGLNWTPNVVPVSTNDVDIPAAGVVNNPVISSAVTVNNLTEAAGRTLTINAPFSLTATGTCTINGTLAVAGSFTCGALAGTGTVTFTGPAAQSIPALTYNNLTINNAAGATLAGSTTVNGALTFTNGVINTGANTLTVGTSGTSTRTAGHLIGNLRKLFSAPGTFVFHVGTPGAYSPLTDVVTFMTAPSGELTVTANTGFPVALTPISGRVLQRYWTLSGNGIRSNLTFQYLQPPDVPATTNEALWHVIRVSGSTVVRYPPGPDVVFNNGANTFTVNNVESYSDWTAGEPLAPTAANAAVSGRVVDSEGRGVYGARIAMQSQDGNVVWTVTNPFGYYRFVPVPVGQTYVVSPEHKRYVFAPRTINLSDDMTGLDFTAKP